MDLLIDTNILSELQKGACADIGSKPSDEKIE